MIIKPAPSLNMTTKGSRSFGEYDSSLSQQILIRDSSDTWFKDLRRGVYIVFIKQMISQPQPGMIMFIGVKKCILG